MFNLLFVIEPYMLALFYNLADRDRIFLDGRDMQDILDVGLFSVVVESDISDMLKGVNCVIPSFDIVDSIRLSQLSKPNFVRRHVIGCSRVDKPYIV